VDRNLLPLAKSSWRPFQNGEENREMNIVPCLFLHRYVSFTKRAARVSRTRVISTIEKHSSLPLDWNGLVFLAASTTTRWPLCVTRSASVASCSTALTSTAEVQRVDYEKLADKRQAENSQSIRKHVQAVRERQLQHFKGTKLMCNAEMGPNQGKVFITWFSSCAGLGINSAE
jgi:hypothetical protein